MLGDEDVAELPARRGPAAAASARPWRRRCRRSRRPTASRSARRKRSPGPDRDAARSSAPRRRATSRASCRPGSSTVSPGPAMPVSPSSFQPSRPSITSKDSSTFGVHVLEDHGGAGDEMQLGDEPRFGFSAGASITIERSRVAGFSETSPSGARPPGPTVRSCRRPLLTLPSSPPSTSVTELVVGAEHVRLVAVPDLAQPLQPLAEDRLRRDVRSAKLR